jgi:L-lactate dehydrogenase complex protein LldE
VNVTLFITCYNDTLFPATGKAVVAVLERLGHTVDFPQAQTCCGQMHYNTGYQNDAQHMMMHFLKVFRDAEIICVPSASCVAMMREHFPKMAAAMPDAAVGRDVTAMLPRVYEFCELLVDKFRSVDTGATFPHTVTLHSTCHSLRGTKIGERPLQLLRSVRGLSYVELPQADQCCGFGGTFSIKNADVSAALLSDKVRAILDTQVEVCTAVDNSCLMHIGGALSRQRAGVRCLHLAEILASTAGEPA